MLIRERTKRMENYLVFFKALANENRQRILFEVFSDKKEHSVQEIAKRIGLANSTTSEHLSILKRASVIISRKQDKEVFYSVNKEHIEEVMEVIKNWLTCC